MLGFMFFVGGGVLTVWVAAKLLEPEVVGPAVAPDPSTYTDAVVQVYGADVWGARGRLAIHTWVATKDVNESTYEIAQVVGWRLRRGQGVVSITHGMPDQPWFRSPAMLLYELKGEAARRLIDPVRTATRSYPFDAEYTMWPGPNSNSFTAWVELEVPQLDLRIPAKALGARWMRNNHAEAKRLVSAPGRGDTAAH